MNYTSELYSEESRRLAEGTAPKNGYGDYDLQQQVTSSREETFRNIGAKINDRDRRKNGKDIARRTIQEKELCNATVDEVDEIEVGSRKRKRRDSASLLSRLIRSCRRSSNQ